MTALAGFIRGFAALLTLERATPRCKSGSPPPAPTACPRLHAFTCGLDLGIRAGTAALTAPFHNGRAE